MLLCQESYFYRNRLNLLLDKEPYLVTLMDKTTVLPTTNCEEFLPANHKRSGYVTDSDIIVSDQSVTAWSISSF